MTKAPNPIKTALARSLSTKMKIPQGHIIGIAYARMFGPKNATTPEGHPIVISSGPFDATVETPAHAIARAARKWMGIEIHEPHWELEMEEDAIVVPGKPVPSFNKFYHFKYVPESQKWTDRNLHDGNVTNHFKRSYYLTRNWQKSVVVPVEPKALPANISTKEVSK